MEFWYLNTLNSVSKNNSRVILGRYPGNGVAAWVLKDPQDELAQCDS